MVWKSGIAVNETGTTMLERPKLVDVAHSSRKLLWFFGMYPGRVIKRHHFWKISRPTTIFILVSLPLLMFRRQFANDQLLDGWAMLWGYSYILIKTLIYSFSKKIAAVESFLQSEIFNSHTKAQDRFVSRAIKHSKIYGGLMRFLSWINWIYYTLFIPADVESLPAWLPVKPNPMLLHVYEILACVISLLVYAALEVSVAALIANTVVQLQILRDNLRNSCKRNPEESYGMQESKIQDRLAKCVRHHNFILRYCKEMEESLSGILFWHIFGSVLGICLSAFQFLFVPTRSFLFVWCLLCVTGFLVSILTCCVFAEGIIVQSSEIMRSCFEADWYVCSLKTKKMLLLIMERAKEPTVLEVKPFFRVSLETYVMILRNAYSYYAVLRNIYKK